MKAQVNKPGLIDPFGRCIRYLRISVTDHCNFRCFYCMPERHADFRRREHILRFEETEQIVRVFAHLGVDRVRITGGEPLMRHNVLNLIERLGRINGLSDLSMTTNAAKLAEAAQTIHSAGIRRLNVSLDTLDAHKFNEITRGGDLHQVLAGLDAARHAGFDLIKINCVVMRGINEKEIINLVDYCIENDFTLRFIETMPMGDLGHDWKKYHLPLTEVMQRLKEKVSLIPAVMPGGGPAHYFRVEGTNLRIGFITPISQHFCTECNRVRLTADGMLYLCLGRENAVDLKTPVREGCTDIELEKVIHDAIRRKPERHEFKQNPDKVIRIMSETGGEKAGGRAVSMESMRHG